MEARSSALPVLSRHSRSSESAAAAAPATCDVLVVGGGPAGATVAALLAERGRHVVLVEKDRPPRFHIGESWLPLNLPLFERLGVAEEIKRIGMLKYGVEFVSPYHGKAVSFEFANAWDKSFAYSYHVRRSEFDHVLLNNARAKGADVIEGCRINDVDFIDEGGAVAKGQDEDGQARSWRAGVLVHPSRRGTLLSGQLGVSRRNRRHRIARRLEHLARAR